jgi:hypothetical protein
MRTCLQTPRPLDIINGHACRSRLTLSMGSDTASQWNLAALSNQAAGSTAALTCPGELDLRSEITLCRFPPPLQIYWLWLELLYSAPNHRPISKHRRNTFCYCQYLFVGPIPANFYNSNCTIRHGRHPQPSRRTATYSLIWRSPQHHDLYANTAIYRLHSHTTNTSIYRLHSNTTTSPPYQHYSRTTDSPTYRIHSHTTASPIYHHHNHTATSQSHQHHSHGLLQFRNW